MQNITTTVDLKEAIQLLERRQAREKTEIEEQFNEFFETFKPINLVKSTVRDFVSSPDLKSNLVNAAIGLTTGFITKKVLLGGSHNPIIRILGTVLELGVATVVSKNPEGIKSMGMNLINRVFNKKKTD